MFICGECNNHNVIIPNDLLYIKTLQNLSWTSIQHITPNYKMLTNLIYFFYQNCCRKATLVLTIILKTILPAPYEKDRYNAFNILAALLKICITGIYYNNNTATIKGAEQIIICC